VSISITFLRPLATTIERLGVDPSEFMRAIGIDESSGPDTFVPGSRVEIALQQLGRRLGDPAIGIAIARASPFGTLGTFDYVIWSSRTLRDAMTRFVRLYAFVARGVALKLEERGGVARLSLQTPKAGRATVLADIALGLTVSRARAASTELPLRTVAFRHAAEDATPYADFFGVTPSFEQPEDALAFDAKVLGAVLPTRDAQTAALLEAEMLRAIAKGKTADPLVDRAKTALARAIPNEALTLSDLAEALGQSSRSLQRQLRQRGTSHRELLDAVRRELALELLADGRNSTAIVAHTLGFATPQAFYRAFLRWTGTTTAAWRASKTRYA
jgi:AraC-like DNA-binding protein